MHLKILTFLLVLTILLCFSGRTSATPAPGFLADDDPEIPHILSVFTDIDAGGWYAQSAAFLYRHGVLLGTGASRFSPEQPLTRGMLAAALYRHAGSPELPDPHRYSDVPSDAWYAAGAAWVWESGLMEVGELFHPSDPVDLETCLAALGRYAGLEQAEAETWAEESGLLDSPLGQERDAVTRAGFAVLLERFCQTMVAAP